MTTPGFIMWILIKEGQEMAKYGLTNERYEQMMRSYDGDEERIKEIVEDWGVDAVNKGYELFTAIGNPFHIAEIERIDDVDAFADDEEAVQQAIKDGIKIIPVEELPENFERRYFGWVDTPENRQAIERWCES